MLYLHKTSYTNNTFFVVIPIYSTTRQIGHRNFGIKVNPNRKHLKCK